MILMVLLSELTRLEVRLVAAAENVRVKAPSRVLSDELRQAMTEHKAALMRYASLPYVVADGVGVLTGNRQEQDITFVAPERQEAWHYKIGVMSLCDGVERFYWPRMVLQARPEDLPDSGWIPSLEDSNRHPLSALLGGRQEPFGQGHSGRPPFRSSH